MRTHMPLSPVPGALFNLPSLLSCLLDLTEEGVAVPGRPMTADPITRLTVELPKEPQNLTHTQKMNHFLMCLYLLISKNMCTSFFYSFIASAKYFVLILYFSACVC